MNSLLPIWIITTMAMHTTITNQVRQLKQEAAKLTNEAAELSEIGGAERLAKARAKINEAQAIMAEAERLSVRIAPQPISPLEMRRKKRV